MRVYLAARFQNKPLLQQARLMCRDRHIEVTSRWLDGDPASPVDNAVMDLEDVDRADALILYIDTPKPGERPMQGAWTEFGYARALKKLIIIIGREQSSSIFLNLPGLIMADSFDEALDQVRASSQLWQLPI